MSAITGQQLANNALTKLGILDPGAGNASSSDSADALVEANSLNDAWQIDDGLIFAEIQVSAALTGGTGSYTIGSGGTFSVARPTKIIAAFMGTNSSRNEVKVVDAKTYYAHNDLTAAASVSDEVFLDFNVDPTTGFASIKTWPVQSGTPTLYLLVGAPFSSWVLGTTYNLPYGYQDAIEWGLAYRLITRFAGQLSQETVQMVTGMAAKAEARVREMNRANRQLPAPEALPPDAMLQLAAQKGA